MYFIHSQDDLKLYIPNVLATIEGEASLYEKMRPDIMLAESWIIDNLIPSTIIDSLPEQLLSTARKAVVAYALYLSVPSLDLVLTPNGFGIVSNQNIAPASKERIDRLRAALLSVRDKAIGILLKRLPTEMKAWLTSEQAKYYAATLFPTFDVCALVSNTPTTENIFLKYRQLRANIHFIEQDLEDRYFSSEQMAVFRNEVARCNVLDTHRSVINLIESYIIHRLNSGHAPCGEAPLRKAVDIIRNDKDNFTQWHASDMPNVWNPTVFQNKKQNAGYWF